LNFNPTENSAFGIRHRNLFLRWKCVRRDKNSFTVFGDRKRDRLNSDLADPKTYFQIPPPMAEFASDDEGIAMIAPIKTAKAIANICIRRKNPLLLWIFI
jgi:hypothetical protein